MEPLLYVLEKYVDLERTGEGEYITTCPFHEDNKPSCSINTKKRIYFCHACSAKGSVFKFLSKITSHTEEVIKYELNQITTLKNGFADFNVVAACNALIKNDHWFKYVTEERGWTKEVIQQNNIGWDSKRGRVTIPVYNIFGDLLNVRFYKPKAGPDDYKVLNLRGFGTGRLYGVEAFKQGSTVYICEGEPDRLKALAAGLSCCSSTSGAGHFSPAWSIYFKDRSVVILYDGDEAGRTGAKKVSRILAPVASDCRIVEFEADQDLTDYFNSGGTTESLGLLVEQSNSVVAEQDGSIKDEELQETFEVTLSESSEQDYYHKRVRMNVMVSGKTLSPYLVPKKVRIKCPLPGLTMCKGCDLGHIGGERVLDFGPNTEETLQLVETSSETHSRIYKEMCGIALRCKLFKSTVLEAQNVEEAKVIPHLDFSGDESQYVMRQIFYIGHGLQSNSSYKIEGLTLPHPRTQQVTYLIEHVKPLEDSINSFVFTEDLIKALKVFCVNTKET